MIGTADWTLERNAAMGIVMLGLVEKRRRLVSCSVELFGLIQLPIYVLGVEMNYTIILNCV